MAAQRSGDFVSLDDISYQVGRVVQETDKESGSVLGISGSDKNEPFVVKLPPPVEVIYTRCLETRGVNTDPPYQKASVKRESDSSGSDEPDEESESYGSTDAFVSSGSHKNMNPSVRSEQAAPTDESVHPVEQRMHLLYDTTATSGHALALSSMTGEIRQANFPNPSPWLQSITRSVSPIGLESATPRGGETLVQTFVRGETHDVVGYDAGATSLVENNVGKIEKMKCPKYKTTTARDNSFVSWPHQNPSKEKMVYAGFFHIPGDEDAPDLVQCYKCGKFLEKFNPGDDPVVEHDKFYPDCNSITWVE